MSVQVLLIEDDQALGAQLVEHLESEGSTVIWWQRGETIGPELAKQLNLVVLDLMLPGRYGLDVLKDLRTFSDVPVLVLSARNDKEDKVRALKLGADDYLTKPFWPEELLARVTARLRRPVIQNPDHLKSGPLEMHLGEQRVWVAGSAVDLTPLEAGLLSALMKRPGSAVARRWLVENLLESERAGAERSLDVHMSRLRKKLGQEGLIETVWGIGYRLRTGEAS
jgi:two-component system response regulator MtrA